MKALTKTVHEDTLRDKLITFVKNLKTDRDMSENYLGVIDGELVPNQDGYGICLECLEYSTDLDSNVEYLMDFFA